MKKTIGLLKIGDLEQSILVRLMKNLELIFKIFNISVNIAQTTMKLDETEYSAIRRQYDASKILSKIKHKTKNTQYFRILGVLDKDIFTRTLNFVFGIANKPNNNTSEFPVAALISITRLREKFYRRPNNSDLFELRILKEAIHELGHTFTLGHCNNFCIMQFSNSLTDTDQKPSEYCGICLDKLKLFFKK